MKVCCEKVTAMLRPMWNRKIQPIHNTMELERHVAWAADSEKTLTKRESNCGKSIREYLENSSLHGLKYIGYTQITIFERYLHEYD